MADAIVHRGPDAEGYWSAPGVGLAHRRLSIIDLACGDQPMGNEDGSVQVVFNGEIYNFHALRRDLLARGHTFRTQSDTEVLVHLYEEHGEGLVERLRGMFAFALWDSNRRQLVLARDRVGQKPLYLYRDHEKLLFGSELKAILAHGAVDRQLDPTALDDYLSFGVVPGSRAIFRRAEKLLPAHVVTLSADNWDRAPRRYWQFQPNADTSRSLAAWSEAVEAKIAETVAAHRIADVPLGAFLSGGLDSSVVVSTLASLSQEPTRTFSMGFEDRALSELPYARQVAERFGCQHTEEIVTPQAAESLDALVHYYDEPFADSSAVPTLQVARLARTQVKVALSGDGGDEAFGGYSRYAHDLREAALRNRLPQWLRSALLAPLGRAWPKADWLPRVLRAKTLLTNLALSGERAYANTITWCRLPQRHRLLADGVLEQLNGHRAEAFVADRYRTAPADDPLAGMIAADVGMLLPDAFLTKVDRASMAYGLEVRPPLVDHELLELVAQIPSHYKVHGGQTKWLLHEIYRDRLPRDVTARPKRGFEIPVDTWLRGPLREQFEAAVLAPQAAVADLVDQRLVGQMFRQHLAQVGRHGNVLWSLLVLARWAERYLRSATPPTGEGARQTVSPPRQR